MSALSETAGSVGGGVDVKIEGTGFVTVQGAPIVTFGGVRPARIFVSGSTTIFTVAPPHAAGPVDVVVTNPDGQSARVTNGFTYVSPESFDPDGEWLGGADGGHVLFKFTIRDRKLTSVSCDTSAPLTVSPATSLSNGEFSFTREDGVLVAGRLVSARDAIGTINLAPCSSVDWYARKQ